MRGICKKATSKFVEVFKKCNWVMVTNITLFAIIVSLGGYYLMQVNNLAITGYSIRDLENEIYELEEENHSLELVIAQKQSIYEIKDKVVDLDLKPVSYLEYFKTDVAKR